MASSPHERYAEFLASQGRRLHLDASRVAAVALSLPGTFDGQDIGSRLAEEVTRPTIYRTLSELVEADLLRRVEFNGQTVFVATAPPAPWA